MDSEDLKCIDRISSLPDDVLCHILSFLPTKYAVATSILSTRWKHLSSLVPNIDLSDRYAGMRSLSYAHCQDLIVTASFKFMQFVCKVLMARGLPNIRSITRFCLNCSIKYDQNILDKWKLFVLLLNVRELDLYVQLEESNTLPCEIFKCKSLEVLKLGAEFLLNVPDSAVLPNLKALYLHFIEIIDDASIRKLLSSCPVLKDLRLFGCRFRESNIIEIAHPLLKNLLFSHAFDEYYVIFDTPNLQNLLYNSYGDSGFLVKNMKSLALAHIAWGSTEKQLQQYEDNDSENLLLNSLQGTTFINEMHNVRSLYLAGCSLNAVYFSNCLMATFQNLTVMELGSTHFSGWLVLPELLAKSPNLEVLVFTEGFIDRYALKKEVDYCLPDSIPVCFSRSLKEIKVADFDGHECEFELLEYFLKSVQVLERMMIGSQASSKSPFGLSMSGRPWNGLKEPPEWVLPTCKRLSAAPRCSEACQIMLTWEEGFEKYRSIILN